MLSFTIAVEIHRSNKSPNGKGPCLFDPAALWNFFGSYRDVPSEPEGRWVDHVTGRTVLGYFFHTNLQNWPEAGWGNFFHVPTVGFGTSEYTYNIALYVGYIGPVHENRGQCNGQVPILRMYR
eukprot:SAG11_NODE_18711_length_483_cov_1.109375_1_plen_122_part_01